MVGAKTWRCFLSSAQGLWDACDLEGWVGQKRAPKGNAFHELSLVRTIRVGRSEAEAASQSQRRKKILGSIWGAGRLEGDHILFSIPNSVNPCSSLMR